MMHNAIESFLRSLRIERNASELTLKSYSEDLDSLLVYFTEEVGGIPLLEGRCLSGTEVVGEVREELHRPRP